MPLDQHIVKTQRNKTAEAVLDALYKRYAIPQDQYGSQAKLAKALGIPAQELDRARVSSGIKTLLAWAAEHGMTVVLGPAGVNIIDPSPPTPFIQEVKLGGALLGGSRP